jgi:hypothetical protein
MMKLMMVVKGSGKLLCKDSKKLMVGPGLVIQRKDLFPSGLGMVEVRERRAATSPLLVIHELRKRLIYHPL